MRTRIRALLAITRFEQTLFGLPVLLSTLLIIPCSVVDAFFALCAFIFARTFGMVCNQWIDLPFDQLNTRTQHRPLVQGDLSMKEAYILSVVGGLGFLICCFHFGVNGIVLGLGVLVLVFVYSWLKRWSAWCHLWIGSLHALYPVLFSWICTHTIAYPALLLGGFIGSFLCANDILYATQDRAFDLAHNLHSIPVVFGKKGSHMIAAFFHLIAIICGWYLGKALGAPVLWGLFCGGIIVCAAVLHAFPSDRRVFISTVGASGLLLLTTLLTYGLHLARCS